MTRFLSICALALFCFLQSLHAQTDAAVLENAKVRLVFVTKPVPFLQRLEHKASGTNLIAEPIDRNLFALEVRQDNDKTSTIESRQAKQGSVEVRRVEGGQSILLRFEGLGPAGDISVQIEGRLDDAEPFVRWSLQVDNPGQQPLTTVRFPYVSAVPAIGSPDDDFIIAPALPGAIIQNPAKEWPESHARSWSFPGQQSVQFLSYQDRTAGVYVAGMDTVGYGRVLRVAKEAGKKYVLCQEYRLSEEPAAQWRSPYEVALGVTSGTWQQTADIYKRWAVRQAWCARTLAQRDDVPACWKRGPCILGLRIRTYDKEGVCTGSYYPDLPEHLRSLQAEISGPVVSLVGAWENHRRWTAGDYFPIFDAANASRTFTRIR